MKKELLIAAVALFATLLAEGKTEAEIKEAIAGHENGYNPEEVEEIYKALVDGQKETNPTNTGGDKESKDQPPKETKPAKEAKPKEAKPKKYVVVSQFADRNNFSKIYNVGDDISSFDAERIKSCIEKGLIKEEK